VSGNPGRDTFAKKLRRRKVRNLSPQGGINLEELERRVLLANAQPTTALTLPAQALIGSQVDFTVGFSNASPTQAGYGPYIDLELPAPGTEGGNGLTFASATYLGAAGSPRPS
jgi:hypothetical protein